MKRNTLFIKITGIFMIVSGSVVIIGGILILVFGAFLVIGNFENLDDIANVIDRFTGIGLIISVAAGVFQFIAGIYGIKNAKNPKKANTLLTFGTITAALFIATQFVGFLSVGVHEQFDNISIMIGVLVPALYITGAVKLKETDKQPDVRLGLFELTVKEFLFKNKERIFEILFTFILCGVIGWAFETIEVWIHHGELTARGILFISHINDFPVIWGLPFILMYGVGGAILIWCFRPLANEPTKLFFVGMLVLTMFEYATAVLCENLLGITLWDYSNSFMNFQGRICLVSSLAWGVLGLVSVKVFAPLFHRLYSGIKSKAILHTVSLVLVVFIIVCYVLRPFLNVEQY